MNVHEPVRSHSPDTSYHVCPGGRAGSGDCQLHSHRGEETGCRQEGGNWEKLYSRMGQKW